MNAGSRLKAIRKSINMKASELADKLEISERAVHKTEASEELNIKTIKRYLLILDYTIEDFFSNMPINTETGKRNKKIKSNIPYNLLGSAQMVRRDTYQRIAPIKDICEYIGIPYEGMERIEYGEFSGKLEDLFVYFYFLGIKINIESIPLDGIDKELESAGWNKDMEKDRKLLDLIMPNIDELSNINNNHVE